MSYMFHSLSYFFFANDLFLHGTVEHMQKEWSCLAKSLHSEPQSQQPPANAAR